MVYLGLLSDWVNAMKADFMPRNRHALSAGFSGFHFWAANKCCGVNMLFYKMIYKPQALRSCRYIAGLEPTICVISVSVGMMLVAGRLSVQFLYVEMRRFQQLLRGF